MSRMYGVSVHKKLAKRPMPLLKDVSGYFFETVLGQKVSDEGVKVISASEMMNDRGCVRRR